MLHLEYSITGVSGTRTVACPDTAASVVLGVIGGLCSTYPIDAIAEVMTNVGSPLWREITVNGRRTLSEGRDWEHRSGGVVIRMREAPERSV